MCFVKTKFIATNNQAYEKNRNQLYFRILKLTEFTESIQELAKNSPRTRQELDKNSSRTH